VWVNCYSDKGVSLVDALQQHKGIRMVDALLSSVDLWAMGLKGANIGGALQYNYSARMTVVLRLGLDSEKVSPGSICKKIKKG
jgi:hypothetical protein